MGKKVVSFRAPSLGDGNSLSKTITDDDWQGQFPKSDVFIIVFGESGTCALWCCIHQMPLQKEFTREVLIAERVLQVTSSTTIQ